MMTYYTRHLLLSWIILIASPLWAANLNEVIAQTMRTNPDFLISQVNQQAAEQRLSQAQAGYWPQINLYVGGGREYSENSSTRLNSPSGHVTLNRLETGINLSQTLFDGFYTKQDVHKQRQQLEASQQNSENKRNTLSLSAAEVYIEVQRRRALLELAKDNLVTHQKTVEQIHQLTTSGVGQQADLRQAQSRLALATANLIQAEGNQRDSESSFQRVVGELPQALDEISMTALQTRLPQDITAGLIIMEKHPALEVAKRELTAAQAEYARVGAAFWPTVKLELQVADNENVDGIPGTNDQASAMLQMQYNLFRGGADSARRKEAALQQQAARLQIENARRELEENFRLAWSTLQTVRNRLEHLTQHQQSSEDVLYAYRQQFKLGRRSLLDVLDAEREWHNARATLTSARYSETFATLRILASMGILFSTLQE